MGEKSKTNTNSQFNLWNRVKNALIGAAMADQPAVMTASGWRQNENGDYVQDQQNDPGVKQLRENISILSGTADGEAGIIGLNFGTGLIKNANKGKQIAKLISKQIDNTTPVIKELPLNVGWGPKQVIHGKHASNSSKALTLYNPERYDVVYEGANPFGVWYQGKLGVPRTAATNSIPGKAEKAQRARELFENRPHMHEGAVILEKPITTVGDVPDRSKLSRIAEQLGSDGIVYNDVYDNGFSNNQVIHSFKLHTPQSQNITQKSPILTSKTGQLVFKGERAGKQHNPNFPYYFTTDPNYAKNYGTVKMGILDVSEAVPAKYPLINDDITSIDMNFAYSNEGFNFNHPVLKGHDLNTGEFIPSKGIEYSTFTPKFTEIKK